MSLDRYSHTKIKLPEWILLLLNGIYLQSNAGKITVYKRFFFLKNLDAKFLKQKIDIENRISKIKNIYIKKIFMFTFKFYKISQSFPIMYSIQLIVEFYRLHIVLDASQNY